MVAGDFDNDGLRSVDKNISLEIKPIRLGTYGRALEEVWDSFIGIRNNGFYAADENVEVPRFSENFAFFGLRGKVELIGEVGKRERLFTSPKLTTVRTISQVGIISSDIELAEFSRKARGYNEEETHGCADFWVTDAQVANVQMLLQQLARKVSSGDEYFTTVDVAPSSSTLMFVVDTARPGLQKLMDLAMKDNDTADKLWPNKLGHQYIQFPMPGSGVHLAVPCVLPANYIEYIVINEKSPWWTDEKLTELRMASVVDGHKIPFVSALTNTVIA